MREVWGSITGPVKSTQFDSRAGQIQRLATVATFLRSCVAQALSSGDVSRNSLHASAKYGEYNEDLIYFFLDLRRCPPKPWGWVMFEAGIDSISAELLRRDVPGDI